MKKKNLFLLLSLTLGLGSMASATIVWQDNFTGQLDGALPYMDYNADGVNDWGITDAGPDRSATVSTAVGNPFPSLRLQDNSSSGINARVSMKGALPFNTATNSTAIQLSFDWRIDAWAASSNNSAFRVNLLNNSGSTILSIGFGNSSSDLFFFAGTSNTTSPSKFNNAIGFDGTNWVEGFNFGPYNSANASSNNTREQFIHFTVTYFDQSTTASIVASYGDYSTNYTVNNITASSFSNEGNGYISFASPGSGIGEAYFDNIVLASIPEPTTTTAVLAAIALVGAFIYRSRR